MPSADDRPIIIGGSHRSGTSLLRRLLNGHRRIFCPPEIKFHKDLLQQFPDDPLRHGRLGSSIAALQLPKHVWLDEFGRALVRCYELAMTNQGKRRWADKNPENALNIHHWDRLLGGNLHFVLVVRHPFDIISSIDETPMPLVIPTTLEGRATHVRDYILAGLAYCEANSDRATIVRYERLVSDPQGTLEVLLDRLGERFESSMLTGFETSQHGIGLEDPKVRHGSDISAQSVGRWRREFSSRDEKVLQVKLAELIQRLGY